MRTCIAEYNEEEQPDEGDVNHNLDEETAYERPDGRIYLSIFGNLAHDGFFFRYWPAEEGSIKERTQVRVNIRYFTIVHLLLHLVIESKFSLIQVKYS